jgi:hypothetical protein
MTINDYLDENGYLQANSDVATAERSGNFSSGIERFQKWDQTEGRMSDSRHPAEFLAKPKEKLYRVFRDPKSVLSKIPEKTQSASREEKILSAIDKGLLGLEIGPGQRSIAPE